MVKLCWLLSCAIIGEVSLTEVVDYEFLVVFYIFNQTLSTHTHSCYIIGTVCHQLLRDFCVASVGVLCSGGRRGDCGTVLREPVLGEDT